MRVLLCLSLLFVAASAQGQFFGSPFGFGNFGLGLNTGLNTGLATNPLLAALSGNTGTAVNTNTNALLQYLQSLQAPPAREPAVTDLGVLVRTVSGCTCAYTSVGEKPNQQHLGCGQGRDDYLYADFKDTFWCDTTVSCNGKKWDYCVLTDGEILQNFWKRYNQYPSSGYFTLDELKNVVRAALGVTNLSKTATEAVENFWLALAPTLSSTALNKFVREFLNNHPSDVNIMLGRGELGASMTLVPLIPKTNPAAPTVNNDKKCSFYGKPVAAGGYNAKALAVLKATNANQFAPKLLLRGTPGQCHTGAGNNVDYKGAGYCTSRFGFGANAVGRCAQLSAAGQVCGIPWTKYDNSNTAQKVAYRCGYPHVCTIRTVGSLVTDTANVNTHKTPGATAAFETEWKNWKASWVNNQGAWDPANNIKSEIFLSSYFATEAEAMNAKAVPKVTVNPHSIKIDPMFQLDIAFNMGSCVGKDWKTNEASRFEPLWTPFQKRYNAPAASPEVFWNLFDSATATAQPTTTMTLPHLKTIVRTARGGLTLLSEQDTKYIEDVWKVISPWNTMLSTVGQVRQALATSPQLLYLLIGQWTGFECQDDPNWRDLNGDWCSTYASGEKNSGKCSDATLSSDAAKKCPKSCNSCPNSNPIVDTALGINLDCKDDSTWKNQWGDCTTYEDGKPNHQFCVLDSAYVSCRKACKQCISDTALNSSILSLLGR